MCRFSCGPAVVTGNDAVTPCNKVTQLHARTVWSQPPPGEFWSLYDCTGCGRCTEYCVHGVPVADLLFEARSQFKNLNAEALLRSMKAEDDPAGDLAIELGNMDLARSRLNQWILQGRQVLAEPKAVYFVRSRGESAEWAGSERIFDLNRWKQICENGSRLRVVDSAWLERRLGLSSEVQAWLKSGGDAGVSWVRTRPSLEAPSSSADLEDSGIEGAYADLFPDAARQMLREIWSQISEDQYDQVWVWSPRAARRLRAWMVEGVIPAKRIVSWFEVEGES